MRRNLDPFGTEPPAGMWQGIPIRVVKDMPRMVLSAECVPGLVPWPAGFKAEIDAWMREFFGTTNLLPDGQVLHIGGGGPWGGIETLQPAILMNPRTYEQCKVAMQRQADGTDR